MTEVPPLALVEAHKGFLHKVTGEGEGVVVEVEAREWQMALALDMVLDKS